MAINFEAGAVSFVSGVTLTFDIDGGSGSDRVLYVAVHLPANRTISTITYDGVEMSHVLTEGNLRLYRLVAPATGVNSFSFTQTGSSAGMRGAGVVVSGVDQATPNDAAVSATVLDVSADQAINVATAAGDSVIGFASVSHSSSGGSLTSLNTELATLDNATTSIGVAHGEDESEVALGWSFTGDGSAGADVFLIGANLNAAAAGGGQTVEAGLTEETDSSFAVAAAKALAVGLSTETDSAFTAVAVRTYVAELAAETDVALAAAATKARAVGQNTETDSALAMVAGRVYAIGQAVESDSAFSIAKLKRLLVGIATESDASLSAQGQQAVVAVQLLRRALTRSRIFLRRG